MKLTLLPVGIVSVFFLLGCITSISAFSDLRSPLHGRRDIADDESTQEINYEDYGGPVPQNLEYDYPTSYGAYGPPFSPPPPVVTSPSSSSSTSSSASGSPSSSAGSGSPSSSSAAANSGLRSHGLGVNKPYFELCIGVYYTLIIHRLGYRIIVHRFGSGLRIRSSWGGVEYGLFIYGFGVDGLKLYRLGLHGLSGQLCIPRSGTRV
ncbi:hypothetical protein DL766_006914 [Monosporascus sp. MC13-8B]|uniref:Uncharacterized protein n=1 Tax=Monosporascus cannonballus TaxID=155416 RepID=A0ABY0HCK0_9PEZI|nr:hypothetical protein DL762_002753 [Monosporascus cannonballus]RYO99648.1 hypothetical protein DL763_001362 [Monosporascus cannonballus]RYP25821.1 hypothetical protein DL766_006914 [Monosporascus sp. MC13-8B]